MQYLPKFLRRLAAAVLALAPLLAVAAGAGYARPELLIETKELAGLLEQPDVRIIDAASPAEYNRAHIPGAINLFYLTLADLEERKKTGQPLSNAGAEKIFGEAGIDENTRVVVYDGGEGPFASGVWFVLDFFGHDKVQVLNGGVRKWLKEGRPVTQDVPEIEKKRFVARPQPDRIVDLAWVKKNLRNRKVLVSDARSFKEYIGEDVRPGASRGGHIPKAMHLEWKKFTGKLETFKPAAEIEKVLTQRGITQDTKVISYCQTGIGRSTDVALALRLIGYDNVRVFTGSWEEWSADPRLPIEK